MTTKDIIIIGFSALGVWLAYLTYIETKAMKERVSSLEHGVREHQRTEEVLQARVTELEKENEGLRKTHAAHEAAVPGAKERIDELVQEIDRCLELIQD